ncbi:transcriptional regulator [Haloferax elongans ATCC BAA-1513]|uniref:Transcriptional regulator n=1 Tax=Haloferax elongans ATCC BAA-1513 TaxID=1230453 RepID=M0HB81_HALEO|nr:phosphate uptake regulator PhoU [Haloferax elongans]ELZ81038.1 transcriptional regulator [Haloferax elongans ATCC BAA-1513]
METRKIQQVSNGTFTVSLPRDWADSVGISAGAVVDLHTHIDGLLVIQPPESELDTVAAVEIQTECGDTAHLEQTLRAAYAAGPSEVVLTGSSEFTGSQKQVIRSVVRNLVGVTIVEESVSHVVVRNVLDSTEVSVRQSIRQLQFVALSMHREATTALTSDAPAVGGADQDDRADRLYAMVERHFTRSLERLDEVDALGETRRELFRLHETARELERIADHAERIADVATAVDKSLADPLAEDVSAVAERARDAVESAVDAVFDDGSIEDAQSVFEARDDVFERVDALERELFDAADAEYQYTHALDSIRRTAAHAGNIAERGLQTAICQQEPADVAVDFGGNEGVGSQRVGE